MNAPKSLAAGVTRCARPQSWIMRDGKGEMGLRRMRREGDGEGMRGTFLGS